MLSRVAVCCGVLLRVVLVEKRGLQGVPPETAQNVSFSQEMLQEIVQQLR